MSVMEVERLRRLRHMGVDVYLPRSTEAAQPAAPAPCIVVRLDRPRASLSSGQVQMLARIIDALNWSGAVRLDDPGDAHAVLEIAFGVAASGSADATIETDAVDRLEADQGRKRALWLQIKAELPRLASMQP